MRCFCLLADPWKRSSYAGTSPLGISAYFEPGSSPSSFLEAMRGRSRPYCIHNVHESVDNKQKHDPFDPEKEGH